VLYGINISKVLHTAKMKSFPEFCKEAYDAEFRSGAQIVRTGEGGRIGRERKKTKPERTRRGKALGGGKFAPPKPYKDRKDIGVPKPTSVTVQQPEQERGSSKVAAALMAASKEERKKAALKRIAAKKSGESSTETKAKPRDLIKGASSLLSTKTKAPKPAPGYTPPKPSGLSNKEQKATVKKGERALRDEVIDSVNAKRKKEGKPPIKSEKELKNKYTSK
jgi:hypothetical protein